MTAAERWLRERAPAAPPRLLDAMAAALPERAASVPDALAAGALALYREVVGGVGDRDAALPLLAADALLTHAFEAQSEVDPTGVGAAASRWGGAGWLGEVADEL